MANNRNRSLLAYAILAVYILTVPRIRGDRQLFAEFSVNIVMSAVALARENARQQAPDHPILWNVPETDYLKFYLFQVV